MRIFYAGVLRPGRLTVKALLFCLGLAFLCYVGFEGRSDRIMSWSVTGRIIVIDAGHGGVDPGAVGQGKALEKDINLAIAKKLKEYITQGGGTAVMIREEDIDLSSPETNGLLAKKREDLAKRLAKAEDTRADLYISIHTNSYPGQNLSGAQIFFHPKSIPSRELATTIQDELKTEFPGNKRAAKANQDFFVLRKNNLPAVTVEVGFISNPLEEVKLQDPNHQAKTAWAIYRGISKFLTENL